MKEIFERLKCSDDYTEKTQVTHYLLNVFERMQKTKKKLAKEDVDALMDFGSEEVDRLIEKISETSDYRKKYELSIYEDRLLGLLTVAMAQGRTLSAYQKERVKLLVSMVSEIMVIEYAIDDMFKADDVYRLDKIEKADIVRILSIVKPLTDELHRGKLYQGLLRHRDSMKELSEEAKGELAVYVGAEIERYLQKGDLTEDEINNIEVAVDICRYFIDDNLIALLKQALNWKHNNIRFYAMETLLINKEEIESKLIAELAADLVYAELVYALLKRIGRESVFPAEYSNPEYLAKSDMVHWLTYPTELGKAPDRIELIGNVTVKKAVYYIFKFMSDSDTLDDESKNIWLIGWASNDGGTFSNFDHLSLYEQKKPEKTLKIIKKKLLG